MKFSYFNQGEKRRTFKQVLRAITKTMSLLMPVTSGYLAEKIFLNPHGRRHYQFSDIKPAKELSYKTRMGQIHVNVFGETNKVVILNHGWGDNSLSFQPMVIDLVAKGYSVASIDHIGHGKSEGKAAHLPAFIDTLKVIISELESQEYSIEAIIGHSMGAMAALNLPEVYLENKKVFLIAVPIDFFTIMFNKVENAGISRHLLTRVLDKITKTYNTTWQQLSLENLITKNHANITFLHDITDQYAPIEDIQEYVAQSCADLITTEGLGHRRILSDPEVISVISEKLKAA